MVIMATAGEATPTLRVDLLYNRLVISPDTLPPEVLPFDKVDVDPSEYVDLILDTCGPSLLAAKTRDSNISERDASVYDFVLYGNAFAAAQELAVNEPRNLQHQERVTRHVRAARCILLPRLSNEARGYLKQGHTPSIAARLLLLNAEHPDYTSGQARVPSILPPSAAVLRDNHNAMRRYIQKHSDAATAAAKERPTQRAEPFPDMNGPTLRAIMEAHLFSYWVTDKNPPPVQLARARRLLGGMGGLVFPRVQLPEFAEEAKAKARKIIKEYR